MGDQTITTISTPTLSLSSLTMMFIHQILCLAVIATRVRSMQEHKYLQSSPTFQKMVYDEDMRCARIVRCNSVSRRRLVGDGGDFDDEKMGPPQKRDSYSGGGAAAPDKGDKITVPETLPVTTGQSYEGSPDAYAGSPDDSDSGNRASNEGTSEDSRCGA